MRIFKYLLFALEIRTTSKFFLKAYVSQSALLVVIFCLNASETEKLATFK